MNRSSPWRGSTSAAIGLLLILWSSAGIVSEIGLSHASAAALLLLRQGIALTILLVVAGLRRIWLPARGSRLRVVFVGVTVTGFYAICYLQALAHGVTPGTLATVLGVQPLLTLLLTERDYSTARLLGLASALGGLVLIVSDGLLAQRAAGLGFVFAGLALAGITAGSIAQKSETQSPWDVLPLQYAVGTGLIAVVAPFLGVRASWDLGFVLPALWLGIMISIVAIALLYALIARGNLVNVTGLFYLVPILTAVMDWLLLGHAMSIISLVGMAVIVVGLMLVLGGSPGGKHPATNHSTQR